MSAVATRPYRPSNGTGGDIFYAAWCARCIHDRDWREREENPCQILNATLIHDVVDPEYPPEWVVTAGVPWGEGNPRCLAFEPEDGDGLIRDPRQMPLPLLEVVP